MDERLSRIAESLIIKPVIAGIRTDLLEIKNHVQRTWFMKKRYDASFHL